PRLAVEPDGAPHHGRIASEAPAPEPIREHHDPAAGAILVAREDAPELRLGAEQGKQLRGYRRGEYAFGRPVAGEGHVAGRPSGRSREAARPLAPADEVQRPRREALGGVAGGGEAGPEHVEAVGVRV